MGGGASGGAASTAASAGGGGGGGGTGTGRGAGAPEQPRQMNNHARRTSREKTARPLPMQARRLPLALSYRHESTGLLVSRARTRRVACGRGHVLDAEARRRDEREGSAFVAE